MGVAVSVTPIYFQINHIIFAYKFDLMQKPLNFATP
ncbi:MAG: hypothetical protein K0R51_1457 [Cytophagaceae bacterium]|jgi:hypothetical protein|nr:hypothetical protein [Cytophagaceae bacterium]